MADIDAKDKVEITDSDAKDEAAEAVELTTSDADDSAAKPATSSKSDSGDDAGDAADVTESGADVTESDDEDEDISLEPDEAAPTRSWVRPTLKIVALIVALAIVAGAVTLTWLWKEQRDKDIAARQALAAAQQFATVLTNVDSGSIDDSFNKTLDGSTGEFKDMYTKSSGQLRQILVENKATAHGVVIDSAVKSASKNKVEVLLFIDQSVSNISLADPKLDRSRVQMTMEKVDGRWLASKVELP